MLKVSFIGQLGADAELRIVDGGKFTTFRAAHNESYTDDAGQEHSTTIWVDFKISDHPKVADYLKQGTQVYVEGYPSLRVYSSPKERCMKAGMTIRVQKIELLGGKVDAVPRQLVDIEGALHDVAKFYWVNGMKDVQLFDKHGSIYNVDEKGFVTVATNTESNESQK